MEPLCHECLEKAGLLRPGVFPSSLATTSSSSSSSVQESALALVSSLSSSEVEEYKSAFQLYDRDGDGTISTREVATLLRALGQNPNEDEVNELVQEIDIDESGTIDFFEFLAFMAQKDRETFSREELRNVFRVFDRDGNGFVSTTELRHVMTRLGVHISDDDVSEMFAEADVDADGHVNFDEFYAIMTAK